MDDIKANKNSAISNHSNKSFDSMNMICNDQGTVSNSSHCQHRDDDNQLCLSLKNKKHLCKVEVNINALRKHATVEGYSCGSCAKLFSSICILHEHLQASHESTGSYHYNQYLKTAFPKFDTCCQSTQTGESETQLAAEVTRPELEDTPHANRESPISTENTEKHQNTSKIHDADQDSLTNTKGVIQETEIIDTWKNVSIKTEVSVQELDNNSDDGDNYFDDDDEAEENAVVTKYFKETENLTEKDNNHSHCYVKRKTLDENNCRKRKQSKTNSIRTENRGTEIQRSKQVNRKDLVKIPRGKLPTSKVLQDPLPDGECKCELCGAKFSFKRGLLRHEQIKHINEMKHECQYCEQKFMREYNLQKHIKCVHTIGRGQKYKEQYRTKKKQEKEKMEEIKVADSAAQPEMETESEEAEVDDKKDGKKREENVSPKAPHTCNICGYTMPRSKMDVHQRLHSGERPYICHVCGKGLISQTKLKRHMLIHAEVKKHTCDVCGAGFQMKYKLRMHMHIHTGKKPYLCSTCGAEFNHSSNLATHTRCVHLQIKPFVCPTCGGRYAKRSQLDDHVLSHSMEKQYTCRYCGKSFKYYKGMRRHEKNHLEERTNFPCDQCDVKFPSREGLEEHVTALHPRKPIKCGTCNKTFKDDKQLCDHERSHSKPRQHVCAVCGERYKALNQFYIHMLAAHGVDRDQARLIQGQGKQTRSTALQVIGQNSTAQLDPNLPLRLDAEPVVEGVKTSRENVNASLNVTQMVSGIMDDNRAAITALTRVATENLRLHSEDVGDEDKLNVIVPPLNPMILLERSQGFSSLTNSNNISVSEGTSLGQGSLVMLAPVSQAIMQPGTHLPTDTIQLQQPITPNQLDHNHRLSQDTRSTSFNSQSLSVPQEARPMPQGLNSGYSIQEARMTLESLTRQHESVSVPLTLMRLSENMMDPPADRQHTQAQEQTPGTANVAYRIQNLY